MDAQQVRTQRSPRDVMADRIQQWVGDASVYDYADRLVVDLYAEGYEFMPSSCLIDGCTAELGSHCPHHGYVLHGQGGQRMSWPVGSLMDDLLAVLTVYDEHVAPENRGPWRDRLAAWVEAERG